MGPFHRVAAHLPFDNAWIVAVLPLEEGASEHLMQGALVRLSLLPGGKIPMEARGPLVDIGEAKLRAPPNDLHLTPPDEPAAGRPPTARPQRAPDAPL
jgi:hypothetical protein